MYIIEKVYYSEYPEYEFVLYHNDLYKNKKNREPHYSLIDRARILQNMGLFDEIQTFPEDTPNEWIRKVKPDIHCTGIEYAPNPAEKSICDELGIELVFVPRIKNLASSTLDSDFINKFNQLFL